MNLVRVKAYYLDENLEPQPVDAGHAVLAEDVAPKWNAMRAEMNAAGFEPFVDAPSPGQPCRSMFRTPADQIYLQGGNTAASLDHSAHQAGRAWDAENLARIGEYYDFNPDDFVAIARKHGFYKTVSTEPWHYDTNDFREGRTGNVFANITLAIAAIGNLSTQAGAAVASAAGQAEDTLLSMASDVSEAVADNPAAAGQAAGSAGLVIAAATAALLMVQKGRA